ncbi:MAG: TonB-dependent receptor plug domain-containing protein [bacterium]
MKEIHSPKIIILLTLLLTAFPALAQDASGDSSQTGSPHVSIDSTLAAVSLDPWRVDDSESRSILAEDIVDYTRLLPGSLPVDLGSVGQLSLLSLRGGSPLHTRILLDSVPLNDPITGVLISKYVPLNSITSFAFPGYGGSYGSAIGGTLDFRTMKINEMRPYSKVVFRAGDFGYSDIGLVFSLPVNAKTGFLLDFSRQEFGGFARNHVGSRLLVKIVRHLTASSSLELVSFLNKNDVTLPAPSLPNLFRNRTISQWKESRFDQLVSLKIGNLAKQKKQLTGRILFTRNSQDSFVDSLSVKNEAISADANISYETVRGKHDIVFDGRLRLHDLNSQDLGDHTENILSAFIRDRINFGPRFDIGLKVAVEKHPLFSWVLNPSFQLHYQITKPMKLWLNFQRARRYPSFSERYWPTFYRGEPQLNDEIGTAAEVGLDFKNKESFEMQASFFFNRVRNWIGNRVLPDTSGVKPANLDDRTVSGLELKLTWEKFPGGRLGLIASVMNVTETAVEKQLQVPEFSIYTYLETGRPFFQKYVFIRLRLAGRMFGRRYGIDFLNPAGLARYQQLDSNAIFDGQISLEFAGARALFSLENLFGTRYQMVPGFFMPEKMFRFSIEWEFWD